MEWSEGVTASVSLRLCRRHHDKLGDVIYLHVVRLRTLKRD